MRKKVVALITIEVHARDVIDKLGKSGCSSTADFEWVSQLRFYWENNDCVVRQVLSIFTYGYEYQGNNGRLVMTPLTDRCYMTLGAALFTRRGGNPLGPAGTGKTETVKTSNIGFPPRMLMGMPVAARRACSIACCCDDCSIAAFMSALNAGAPARRLWKLCPPCTEPSALVVAWYVGAEWKGLWWMPESAMVEFGFAYAMAL